MPDATESLELIHHALTQAGAVVQPVDDELDFEFRGHRGTARNEGPNQCLILVILDASNSLVELGPDVDSAGWDASAAIELGDGSGASPEEGEADLDPDAAADWIEQVRPRYGRLRTGQGEPGEWVMLYECDIPRGSENLSTVALEEALDLSRHYWWTAPGVAGIDPILPECDPLTLSPRNAWLIFGDGASIPGQREIDEARADAARGVYWYDWTCAKQTEPGDLLFGYFIDPDKSILFVARAATAAFYSDQQVNAKRRLRGARWWTVISPPEVIPPISFAELQQAAGAPLNLKGASGKLLRPEAATLLMDKIRASGPMTAELAAVLSPVTGHPDLPDPATTDLTAWRDIPSGPMHKEALVEQHVVEPLLRLASGHTNLTWSRQYRVGGGLADYVVLEGDRPVCVVEAKIRIRHSAGQEWSHSPDFQQVSRYAAKLGCPSVLIDAHEMHLIEAGGQAPQRSIRRADVSTADLEAIGKHLGAR